MASPQSRPAASQAGPLSDRLLHLYKTKPLQFAWLVGHGMTFLCTVCYFLSFVFFGMSSRWAAFHYRSALLSTLATYGIVIYRAVVLTNKSTNAMAMATDDNVQYLAVATLLFLSPTRYMLSLLPYFIYTIFHILQIVKPEMGRMYYDRSMAVVAQLEYVTWVRLLLSALTFSKYSLLLWGVYTAFLRVRYAQNKESRVCFSQMHSVGNSWLNDKSMPQPVTNAWNTLVNTMVLVHDKTDIFGPPSSSTTAQPAKKTS